MTKPEELAAEPQQPTGQESCELTDEQLASVDGGAAFRDRMNMSHLSNRGAITVLGPDEYKRRLTNALNEIMKIDQRGPMD